MRKKKIKPAKTAAPVREISNSESLIALDLIFNKLDIKFKDLPPGTMHQLEETLRAGYAAGLGINVIALELNEIFIAEKIFRPGDYKQETIFKALLTI